MAMGSAPALALHRLPGARDDHPAVEAFVAELRAVMPLRPNLTEAHVAFIENILANAHQAATDDPALLDLWDALVAVIRSDRTVKERLTEFGRIGERLDEQLRGRAH
jgi:hypothetical protein